MTSTNSFGKRMLASHTVQRALQAVDACRAFVNQPKIRRVVALVGDISNATHSLTIKGDKPIPTWELIQASVNVCKVLVAAAEVEPDTYFDGDEWAMPYASEFSQTIVAVLRKRQCRMMATTRPGIQIVMIDLDGCEVGWVHDRLMFDRPDQHVYVRSDQIEEARQKIKTALWSHFANKSVVLKRSRRASFSSSDSFFHTFEQDHDEPALHSQTSRDLSAYLGRAIAGGVTRSLLLWGAPGTGKTSLARAVVDELGLRSLRLRVEDLGRLQNSTLLEAIDVFGPDAVIVDDLDRLHGGHEHMFEMLSTLKRRVKLVLGTCNNKKKIPAALRRPGRWDERRRIDVVDQEIVRAMLGTEYADAYDTVKSWPIVYVEEYVVRRRFQAPEELRETVRELEECIAELRQETDGETSCEMQFDPDDEID